VTREPRDDIYPYNQRYRFVPACALSLGIALTSALVVAPLAQASPRPALSAVADCRTVSSAAASAIVGYTLPAATADTIKYRGLGSSYYYKFAVGGITIRGISVLKGVNGYGAFAYSKTLSKSKLASLAKLAEKL
jgi:hypothetical protein